MPYQVPDALLHAMSGTELSRVRTELRLLPPEAYQQKSDRVERGRHCYAIKWKLVEYRPAPLVRERYVNRILREMVYCHASVVNDRHEPPGAQPGSADGRRAPEAAPLERYISSSGGFSAGCIT